MEKFESMVIPFEVVQVKELKKIIETDENLNKYPGVYKFWAGEAAFKKLLKGCKYNVEFDEVSAFLETMNSNKEKIYCIYVGKSDKRPLSERVKSHIFEKGKSSLNTRIKKIIKNMNFSNFVDKLYFSCELYKLEPKSYPAALITSQQELFHINSYPRILNYDDNFVLK